MVILTTNETVQGTWHPVDSTLAATSVCVVPARRSPPTPVCHSSERIQTVLTPTGFQELQRRSRSGASQYLILPALLLLVVMRGLSGPW